MKQILLFILIALPTILAAQAPTFTFTPSNGASGVSLTGDLLIVGSENLKLIGGGTINDTNVDGLITLVDGSMNPVAFDATITANKDITINPTGAFTEKTIYTLTLSPVENNGGQASTTKIISFTTGDFTDPSFTTAQAINNSGSGFTFKVNVSEAATIYYVVDRNSTSPDETEVRTFKNGIGVVAEASGSFFVNANTDVTTNITGLDFSPPAKFYVYFFAEDQSGNTNAVAARGIPLLNSSAIPAPSVLATQLDLRVNVDEAVTTYYVVTQSSTQPTASQILAGQNASGGTPDENGNFTVGAANTNTDHTITGLTDLTLYYVHFVTTDAAGNQTIVETESATTTDGTGPVVSTLNAADGAAIDISTNTFTVTFNELVSTINVAPADNAGRIRLFENGVLVEDINRNDTGIDADGSIVADGTSATATITFVYNLLPYKSYYILIGADVFEDAAGNDFDGFAATTDWNFTSTGVSINNITSSICGGSFQSISNIVISENGPGNFNNGAGQTLELSLANTSEFVLSTSGVSVSGTSADITSLVVAMSLTKITITYTVSGGTVNDNITLSGLKVYATGAAATTTIIRTAGSADQDGNNGVGAVNSQTHATINVGAIPPSQPQLAATQDNTHCVGENISAKTLTLVDQGPAVTYAWYGDPALSNLRVSTTNEAVTVVADLGMTTPAVAGTYKFYVVAISACQSAPPVEVIVYVTQNPVANAGTDLSGAGAICHGDQITLGGNPTLSTPSAPGSYTYAWDYVGGTPEPNAEANPVYTVSNTSGALATYNFSVTITDANGCVGTDTKTVEVKSSFNVSLSSPNSTVFSPNSPNQNLVGSPAGGVFSGIGVVQSNPGTYQFSPVIAHATDPNTLPKSFPLYYTITSNGCTATNVQVATFIISNSFFATLQPAYCSNEYPDPTSSTVNLSLDLNGFTQVNNREVNWNTSDRFYQGPYNTPWQPLVTYAANSYVRYNNEIYQCDPAIALFGCSGFSPPASDPGQWNANVLKVKFDGLIQNYYDDYYGGNASGPSIVKSAATYTVSGNTFNYYKFGTDVNYLNCPSCNYSYAAAYLEFERPEDINLIVPEWVYYYYYYQGDLVRWNNRVYRCIITNSNNQPDFYPGVWADVTGTDFGNGEYFHKFDAALGAYRSGFYVRGQFVQINKNPTVFFSGLANGEGVCEFDVLSLPDNGSSSGNTYNLTGNFSNQNLVQDFSVKLDGSAVYNSGSGTITNNMGSPGKATFDTKNAFINSTGGSSAFKNIEIQYRVNPGTLGSTSLPCYGTSSIVVQVMANSTFDFDDAVDPQGSVYCYTEAGKDLRAKVGASVITGNSGTPNSVVFSGYGVSDLGNSRATFTPAISIEQLSPGTTVQQSIPVTATYRDANRCLSTQVRTFNVNPDIAPSFTFAGRANYCYEDLSNSFLGHTEDFTHNSTTVTSSGNYQLIFKDPGGTGNVLGTDNSNNTTFTAKQYYDAVQTILTNGGFTADLNQSANIQVIYTESLNAGKLCSETFQQTMVINPPLALDIFGLDEGDILCRNNNSNVSLGNLVTFEGSVTGSGVFSLDDDNNFSAVNATLNGTVNTSSGKATINLLAAYNAASDATDPRKVFLQYQYSAPGCTGPANVIKSFEISPPPTLNFDFSAGNSPINGETFCYDETPAQLKMVQNTNVILSGYGVKDSGSGNGVGTFNPELAYNTSISNGGTLNSPQNVLVNSYIIDNVGCVNTKNINYIVNPVPTATLNYGSPLYCYEDPARTLQGQQAKSWFSIEYQGVSTPFTDNIGDITDPESSVTFNPKARFDHASNLGASTLTPVNFNVFYSVADNNNCTNTIGPITLSVANQIDVVIAGLDDNDIFCSNETNGEKVLSFNPFPADASKRTFTINGQSTPLTNEKYTFTPGLTGGDFKLKYVVISGNNCTNTDSTSVRILPSPQATFGVQPACEGDLIDFNGDGSQNSSAAIYTWSFNDSLRTGQNLQHRFPTVGALSSYGVQLRVHYPAYNNDPALVCRDSLRLDQIVGPVPKMDFEIFNVCESDQATFEAKPDIAISQVSWDFGDGINTPMGFSASNIPTGVTATSGTFQSPVHVYSGDGEFHIFVTGKTADIFGGCVDTADRVVSILKNWAPSPAEPSYDMAQLDGGRGFWVREDRNGNASWEFNTAAKQKIKTNEMAWVTGPTLPYKPLDISYVNSPCFDLSTFTRPVLSLKHWTDTESSDGAVIQYSIDGGENWVRLGNVASGLEWYNRLTISANPGEQTDLSTGWSLTDQLTWALGKHTLDVIPGTRNQVRFRVAFSSFNNRENRDGFAFNNFVIEERNRTILVENFTNLSDEANNTAYKNFKTVNGVFNTNELVKLQYHHAFARPSPKEQELDQLHQGNAVDQNARAAFYGVTDPVRAFIDGGFGQKAPNFTFVGSNNNINPLLDSYFSLRSLVTSPIELAISFPSAPDSVLNVKASIQATTTLAKGMYNVFIAVAERDVLNQKYVLRKFLPDASGTPLTALSATDSPQEITFPYDMRHVTRLANGEFAPIAVVVFVQNLESKDVLQTIMRQDASPASYVVTGVETSHENIIGVYPNPADRVMHIVLPAPVMKTTPVKIFDSFGRQVYDGVYKSGQHSTTLETKNLSAGVYLIQLETKAGVVHKKAMIVHE